MDSPRVTMTRLQRESSRAFTSHLNRWITYCTSLSPQRHHYWIFFKKKEKNKNKNKKWEMQRTWTSIRYQTVAHIRSSAAVFIWDLDSLSFGSDESGSLPFVSSILPKWRIAATTLKIASWNRVKQTYQRKPNAKVLNRVTRSQVGHKNVPLTYSCYLLIRTNSNNIHGPPSC